MLCHSYSVSILLLVLLHIRCTSQSVGTPETNEQIQSIESINYKPTDARMGAIQLGIANSIEYQENKKRQDVLVKDFQVIEKLPFPSQGSKRTPSHAFGYFRFDTYAPNAFRYFRELYNINPADFIKSLCTQPLKELSNPGASGSLFYVSNDDKFIIKTVEKSEADFLQTLLDSNFLNIHQNPKTFLPKFFGLFSYQSLGKSIRLVVMNNLLPTSIVMHHKFDLKGSTLNRFASEPERNKIVLKQTPTLKDLDFNKEFENGISLDAHTYDNLMNIIERDVRVLENHKIIDYSLLIGIHNIDRRVAECCKDRGDHQCATSDCEEQGRKLYSLASTKESWKSFQLDFIASRGPFKDGGVPARNAEGERLLIFLGIIDILQRYGFKKWVEHNWKSISHESGSISVTDPKTYADRFQKYISNDVFRKTPVNTAAAHVPTHITTEKAEEIPKTEKTKPIKALAIKKQRGKARQPKTVDPHEGTQKQGCEIEEEEDHIICINGTESYGTLNYAQDRKDSEAILISKVDVLINKRRQGVGTAMLNYFIEEIAKKRGYKKIKLIVIRGRENIVEANFYKKAGFKFVANSTNYTNLMTLELPETQSVDRPRSLEKGQTYKDSEESGSSKENSTGK